jgi:cyclophilin family peptidyl-prolyl cis-trans isomerase
MMNALRRVLIALLLIAACLACSKGRERRGGRSAKEGTTVTVQTTQTLPVIAPTITPIATPAPAETPKPTSPTAALAPDPSDLAQFATTGPVVVVSTNMGDFEIQLDPVHAPLTTGNFLEYVNARFYYGLTFHRVMPNFIVQGGGFSQDLTRRPPREPIRNESDNGLRNVRGSVAMARVPDEPDGATTQFFVNLRANSTLDSKPGKPGYAVFGRVAAGWDTVNRIAGVKTMEATTPDGAKFPNVPADPVIIKWIRLKGPEGAAAPPSASGPAPTAVPIPKPTSPPQPAPEPTSPTVAETTPTSK